MLYRLLRQISGLKWLMFVQSTVTYLCVVCELSIHDCKLLMISNEGRNNVISGFCENPAGKQKTMDCLHQQ
jgi:hypothetical protein